MIGSFVLSKNEIRLSTKQETEDLLGCNRFDENKFLVPWFARRDNNRGGDLGRSKLALESRGDSGDPFELPLESRGNDHNSSGYSIETRGDVKSSIELLFERRGDSQTPFELLFDRPGDGRTSFDISNVIHEEKILRTQDLIRSKYRIHFSHIFKQYQFS